MHANRAKVYLRLSVTDRCNLRCVYCRLGCESSERPPREPLEGSELVSLVRKLHRIIPLYKIRVTGGEPLLRPDLPEIVEGLKHRVEGAKVHVSTNGTGLSRRARALHRAGVDGLQIRLDSPDESVYRKVTRAQSFAAVLAGIRAARRAGLCVESLKSVLLRSYNRGSLPDLVRFAAQNGCEIRFMELLPGENGGGLFAGEYLSAEEALKILRADFSYERRLEGSSRAERHLLREGDQPIVVGFVPAISDPLSRPGYHLQLDCRGWVSSCLRGDEPLDMVGLLRQRRVEELHARVRAMLDDPSGAGGGLPLRPAASRGG